MLFEVLRYSTTLAAWDLFENSPSSRAMKGLRFDGLDARDDEAAAEDFRRTFQ